MLPTVRRTLIVGYCKLNARTIGIDRICSCRCNISEELLFFYAIKFLSEALYQIFFVAG